ncbi:MAG: siphovirus ReqiPepy6 Gp37-like family protein [Bacteroidales bacterium]|nr:siphovirus ReqiPepy6 Gp37-like family protein [Bacteroidales bacterium]
MMECSSVNVYDENLDRVGVVYTWVSMIWIEGYNFLGSFQLEVQQTDRSMELLQKDRYCGISGSDTLMFIESVQIANNEILINGFPATVLLSHRVSTTEISNQNAETAMRNLVSAMSSWPRVALGSSAGITDTFTPQISDMSLEEYCETIGQECDVGFKMVHDRKAKQLLFTVYKPERNENAKYSSQYGNVGDIVYILSDSEYKNVAIVAGAGEGSERVTVTAGDTSSTGLARREMYVDARQEQPEDGESTSSYRQRLIEYGEGKLVEQAQIEEISFSVKDEVGLGDIVFVYLPEIKIKLEARVSQITITSENNGTTREITVGTPFNITRLI